MNGMQGLVLGVAVGGAVAGGVAMLALQGQPAATSLDDTAAPDANGTTLAPEALAKLQADANRLPQLQAELAAAKAQAAAATDAGGAAAVNAAAIEQLKAEILVLTNEREALRAKLAEAKAAADASGDTGGAKPGTFRFGLAGKTPVFDNTDWPKLGGHMVELAKAIVKLPEQIAKGEQIDMATRQKLQQHNTPLAGFAVSAAAELGGTGANGAFTHPAVMANLMRAALESAGDPLTSEQERGIAAAGETWASNEAARLARYTDATPALAKTIDEVDLKQAFLNDARQSLTVTQQAIIFPPATEGRAQLDLFSPALVYVMRLPVNGFDRTELETKLLESLVNAVGLKAEQGSQYAYIATQWLDALPKALEAKARRDSDVTFPHVNDIQAAAKAQLAATEKLLALGELTDEQTATLRANTTVLMPQLLKTN